MIRALFLSPARTDTDVSRHAAAIASIKSVRLEHRQIAAGATLIETLRMGADLYRARCAFDVVVAVGPAALAAAGVSWRGPLVHIPVGELTPGELRAARRIAIRSPFALVTTSNWIANTAAEIVDDARVIHLLRPDAAPPTLTRAAARQRLGVAEQTPLFHLVGLHRRGSGHRMGLWVTSILAFRDAAARATVALGGERDDFLARFAASTNQTRAIIADAEFSPADFAVAADVAICPADGAADWAALEACRAVGTPIVGLRGTWEREALQKIPVTFADEPRARAISRAALETFDRRTAATLTPATAETASVSTSGSTSVQEEWSTILASTVQSGFGSSALISG